MLEKKCSKCEIVKSLDEFHKQKKAKGSRVSYCKECVSEYGRQYHKANREKIREQAKKHYQRNKEKRYKYARNRKADHPVIALRSIVSSQICQALNRNNGSKQGESVMKHLPYTMSQLKEHLESQFEDGMTWGNHTRDGWHIDHIIPQSKLPYDSMDDPNFQKCWALENLQPLEAKENMSLGNREKM